MQTRGFRGLAIPSAVALVLQQETTLRALGSSSSRLSPPNAYGKPHAQNRLRFKDWIKWLRRAFVEVCQMGESEQRRTRGPICAWEDLHTCVAVVLTNKFIIHSEVGRP